MNYEKVCETCVHDEKSITETPCNTCVGIYKDSPSNWEAGANYRPMTNYEHIMSMNVEQLALFITEYAFCNFGCAEAKRLENEPLLKQRCDERCAEHCERWLEQECGT